MARPPTLDGKWTGQVVYGQQPSHHIRQRELSGLRVWGAWRDASDRSKVLREYLSWNEGRRGACPCLEAGLEGMRPVPSSSHRTRHLSGAFPSSCPSSCNKHPVISPTENKTDLCFLHMRLELLPHFLGPTHAHTHAHTCTPLKGVALLTVGCFPRLILSWSPARLSSPHYTETTLARQKDGATADPILAGQEPQRCPWVFSPLILTASSFSSLIFTLSMTFSTPHCTAQAQTQAQATVTSCRDWQPPPHWSFLFIWSLLRHRSLTGLLQWKSEPCYSSGQSCRWLPMALRIEAEVHFHGLEVLPDVVFVFLLKPHSNYSPLTHSSPALSGCSTSGQTCPRAFALGISFPWKAHSSDFNDLFSNVIFSVNPSLTTLYHLLPLSNRMFCDDGVVLCL